ncbi:MAG: efflux RND transporter periplasmic adaptor subunit, partial [Sulfitobacter sp.]
MRIFPILAAIAVSAFMYMAIFEREALLNTLGFNGAPPPSEDTTSLSHVADQSLVKVVVQRSQAKQLDSAIVVRGQTAAARQVAVQAETSAIVISPPLRKGARVAEGETLCKLDLGTRDAQQKEAVARHAEAESRVPEAEARVEEAQARL